MADPPKMRIDRFLWWARIAKSRSIAQKMAEAGTLRLDGRRIDRAHAQVRPGSIIAFARGGDVRVLRVESLPTRRGPPAEAALLFTDLRTIDTKSVDASVDAA